MRLTGTIASRWVGFFASRMYWITAVHGSSSEAGGSLLYGEDGILRGLLRIRDGLVGVDNPVMPATG